MSTRSEIIRKNEVMLLNINTDQKCEDKLFRNLWNTSITIR